MGKRPLVPNELSKPECARLWLREARFQKDLRAWEVARKAGICENYYSKIELGLRRPSVKLAQKLGEILGFSWTKFFEKEEPPEDSFFNEDPDAHSCAAEADAYGICTWCGAIVHGTSADYELHGYDPTGTY